MAEPVGIVGTAAGLVSLGLQVYTGITDYLDALKGRHDDLRSANAQRESLRESLKIIEKVQPRLASVHPDEHQAILPSMGACNDEFQRLNNMLQDLLDPSSSTGVKQQMKKLSYPFHRSRLIHLEDKLQRANSLLQTVLGVLELSSLLDVEEVVSKVNAKTEQIPNISLKVNDISNNMIAVQSELSAVDSHINSMAAGVRKINTTTPETLLKLGQIEQGVNTLITRTNPETPQIVARNTQATQDLGRAVQHLAVKTDQSSSHMLSNLGLSTLTHDQMTLCLSKLSNIEEALGIDDQDCESNYPRALRRLVLKPGYTKQVYDEFSEIETADNGTKGYTTTISNEPVQRRKFTSPCYCQYRAYSKSSRFRLGSFFFKEDSITHSHKPGCKFDILGSTKTQSLALITSVLSHGVRLTLSVTTGAGGLSISPNINLRPVVDENKAPVFRIMKLLTKYSMLVGTIRDNGRDLPRLMDLCKNAILRLYRERKASPYEVNKKGRTFFHYWARFVSAVTMWQKRMHTAFNEHTKDFLQAGLPAYIEDINGESPVHVLSPDPRRIPQETFRLLLNELQTPLVKETVSSVDPWNFKCMSAGAAQFYSELYGFGPLSTAIVKRDLRAIKTLATDHAAIMEANQWKQTTLHLAVPSPDILKIIVHIKVWDPRHMSDKQGLHPIDLALRLSSWKCDKSTSWDTCHACLCTESLDLLISSEDYLGDWLRTGSHHIDSLMMASNASRVRVIDELKYRRDQLRHLAKSRLTSPEINRWRLNDSHVLDLHTGHVVDLLQDRGYEVPTVMRTAIGSGQYYRSIYHLLAEDSDDNAAHLAPLFFRVGFQDIDVSDVQGKTPLVMALSSSRYNIRRSFGYVRWLVEHGADIQSNLCHSSIQTRLFVGHTSLTVAHDVFRNLTPRDIFLLRPMDPEVLRHASLIRRFDDCRCSCASHGCTPVSLLFQKFVEAQNIVDDWGTHNIAHWLKVQPIDLTSHSDLCISAIRVLTFGSLGLKHTCCHAKSNSLPMSWDEVEEIYEEQLQDVVLLEDLMREFEQKLDELGLEFTKFLVSYWEPRMNEVHAELEAIKLTDKERQAAESIGVTWLSDSSSKPKKKVARHYGHFSYDCGFGEDGKDKMEYYVRELNKICSMAG